MTDQDAVEMSEEKGTEDGTKLAPYSPAIRFGICKEADTAYSSAYFNAMVQWEV